MRTDDHPVSRDVGGYRRQPVIRAQLARPRREAHW
jgi:hypothetical protein